MKIKSFILIILVLSGSSKLFSQEIKLTARQVIDEMKSKLTCSWNDETVDKFKIGNPDDQVTGIAVCMFPDMATLRKAVAQNCNLLIVHEPTFYNHLDDTVQFKNDPVYLKKRTYIDQHHLIIFRFHDHWHRTSPDGIYVGMVNKLGWKANEVDNSMVFFKFPEQTVNDFAKKIQEKLTGSQMRIVGDREMKFTNVALSVGAPGEDSHIKLLNNNFTQVLVAGEAREWETYEYVLDASMLGMKKAAIFTGHIPSEEAGMEYCAEWLKTFIKSVSVRYIENGPSFHPVN